MSNNKFTRNDKKAMAAGGATAATGTAIALGGTKALTAVVAKVGIASTGTAISTLSGAAATSATTAAIGGGALAAGGGGMAAGSTVLVLIPGVGWGILGAGVLIGGGVALHRHLKNKRALPPGRRNPPLLPE